MIRTEHVRTGDAFPFEYHGAPSNGEDCGSTLCDECGCCQHCQHPCDCTACGCDEWGEKVEQPPTDDQKDWAEAHAEIKALRDKLALIEVAVALWEAGAESMRRAADMSGSNNPVAHKLRGKAEACAAHAEQVRDILKGE